MDKEEKGIHKTEKSGNTKPKDRSGKNKSSSNVITSTEKYNEFQASIIFCLTSLNRADL